MQLLAQLLRKFGLHLPDRIAHGTVEQAATVDIGRAIERVFQRAQARAGEQRAVTLNARQQGFVRRDGKHPFGWQMQRLRGGLQLMVDAGGDLRRGEQRVPQRIDLVERHQGLRAAGGRDVAVPDFQIAARDPGVGAEHEDHGVGRGDEREGQLGLGAHGVEPRGIENAQALIEQWMGKVDQRMTP